MSKQSKYLWFLINQICKKNNSKDKYEVYCNLLEAAGGKYDEFLMPEDAYRRFKRKWPESKISNVKVVNHQSWATVKAFYGSKNFSPYEMSRLVKIAQDQAKLSMKGEFNAY